MLNISNNSIIKKFEEENYTSLKHVNSLVSGNRFRKILSIIFGASSIFLFLPWTQNVIAPGELTTLLPEQRPQTIHSVISGRIENWYFKEGDFVNKGDTILFISEIKDEYFDPQLLERTREQVTSKSSSVIAYQEKIAALDNQIVALKETRKLKIEQAKNKLMQAELSILSDSMNFEAAEINREVALSQFNRMQQLYDKDLKSLTDLENRKNILQEAQNKLISAENKLLKSRNELINAKIEINSVENQYSDEIAKATSEKFNALSNRLDAEVSVAKLENQFSNYSIRRGFYHITAPQSGFLTKVIQAGIGETIKEGTPIISIMPETYDLSVELYIEPIDLPLIEVGQKVRIQFDGWPAIVFSGWPNTSYGTYGGVVFAYDNFISPNGKFRILVKPDLNEHSWPKALRVGGGTRNILLLNKVPIWYELWRKINGFPPDYYKTKSPIIVNSK
tara:strand:- start:3543 stop:4892 length:1350 start_codon:yes stop_codon:yes gene_type:complete